MYSTGKKRWTFSVGESPLRSGGLSQSGPPLGLPPRMCSSPLAGLLCCLGICCRESHQERGSRPPLPLGSPPKPSITHLIPWLSPQFRCSTIIRLIVKAGVCGKGSLSTCLSWGCGPLGTVGCGELPGGGHQPVVTLRVGLHSGPGGVGARVSTQSTQAVFHVLERARGCFPLETVPTPSALEEETVASAAQTLSRVVMACELPGTS